MYLCSVLIFELPFWMSFWNMFSVLFSFELNVLYIFVNCNVVLLSRRQRRSAWRLMWANVPVVTWPEVKKQQDGMNNRRNEDERWWDDWQKDNPQVWPSSFCSLKLCELRKPLIHSQTISLRDTEYKDTPEILQTYSSLLTCTMWSQFLTKYHS